MSKNKIEVLNTPSPNKIEMLFYKTAPSKENTGLKFVLWEIGVPVPNKEGTIDHKYDWGFGYWNGDSFDELPNLPEDCTGRVMRWSNTPDPAILLNESKIITSH